MPDEEPKTPPAKEPEKPNKPPVNITDLTELPGVYKNVKNKIFDIRPQAGKTE
jgi:hypothetical protein